MIDKQDVQRLIALQMKYKIAELSDREKHEQIGLERQYSEFKNKTSQELKEEVTSEDQSIRLGR